MNMKIEIIIKNNYANSKINKANLKFKRILTRTIQINFLN